MFKLKKQEHTKVKGVTKAIQMERIEKCFDQIISDIEGVERLERQASMPKLESHEGLAVMESTLNKYKARSFFDENGDLVSLEIEEL